MLCWGSGKKKSSGMTNIYPVARLDNCLCMKLLNGFEVKESGRKNKTAQDSERQ